MTCLAVASSRAEAARAAGAFDTSSDAVERIASAVCGPSAVTRALPVTPEADNPSTASTIASSGSATGSRTVPVSDTRARVLPDAAMSRPWTSILASGLLPASVVCTLAVTLPATALPINGDRSASRVIRADSVPTGTLAPWGRTRSASASKDFQDALVISACNAPSG